MKSQFKIDNGNIIIKFAFVLMSSLLLIARTYAQLPAPRPPALTLTSATTPFSGDYTASQSILLQAPFSTTPGAQFSARIIPPLFNCTALGTPSISQNYLQVLTPRSPFTDASQLPAQTVCDVNQTIQYFDGLGRAIQTVQVGANPDGTKDLIQPVVYDQMGREVYKYLPYTASTVDANNNNIKGSFRANAVAEQKAFYDPAGTPATVTQLSTGIAHIASPFSMTGFEPSPINRIVEQGAPGDPWQLTGTVNASGVLPGHTVKTEYASNDAASLSTANGSSGRWAEQYMVNFNTNTRARTLSNNGSAGYALNSLSVTVSKDENWSNGQTDPRLNTTETYKNKEGHLVLKRTFNYNNTSHTVEVLSTYYVYDDFGNLCYVLPPGANPDAGLSTSNTPDLITLGSFCYQYNYDERNRRDSKKLPGKDIEYMIYDTLDQLVATQDGKQRGTNQWTITKYDVFGRVIMTGTWANAIALTDFKNAVNAQTQQWENLDNGQTYGYTLANTFPNSLDNVLSVNYYDGYNFPAAFSPPGYTVNSQAMPAIQSQMTTGLLTGSLTAILNGTNNNSSITNMLWSVNYYDDRGRVIQTNAQHFLGGTVNAGNYDQISNAYDFTSALTQSIRVHHNATLATSPATITIANVYVYDHMGRKRQNFEQINNDNPVLVDQTDFNEIGQMLTRHLHSEDQGDSFLQDIAYSYNERGWLSQSAAPKFAMQLQYNDGTTSQFNGNIANQKWGTAGNLTNMFTYSYDNLNRLISGTSANFSETGISYDLMGNITSLIRDGNAITYTYMNNNRSNQLQSVSGAGLQTCAYVYDNNGNTLTDGSKNNIQLTYNLLNLPQTVSGSQNVMYTYDAAGRKLSKNSTSLGLTEYISGMQYDKSSGTYLIDFIQTEEGRASRRSDGTFRYEYDLADHIGDTRVTIFKNTSTGNADIQQADDYYPFGLRKPVSAGINHYLYNKKELQDELNEYDYGARFYDPVIGRFTTIDRFAEKYKAHSSYVYTLDNPIKTIDINGDSSVVLNAPRGANGEGHMAQLIQNPNGTYSLYSKNGTNESAGLSGPNDKAPGEQVGVGSFKTPKDFMNSSLNPVIDKKTGEREYSEGYLIPATKEQDKQNIAGEKKVLSEPYDVLDSSCGTAVQSGLKAEGKNDGSLTPLQFLGVALESLSTGPAVENDKSPNEIYKRVKENNKGKVVTPGN